MVPVTTPTATVTVYPFAILLAMVKYMASLFRSPRNSRTMKTIGMPTPIVAKIIWNPRVDAVSTRPMITSSIRSPLN